MMPRKVVELLICWRTKWCREMCILCH